MAKKTALKPEIRRQGLAAAPGIAIGVVHTRDSHSIGRAGIRHWCGLRQ